LGIGELAQIAGVTPRTIRYYVAEGLLPPPSGAGPQRSYSVEHVLRLQAIQRLKESYLPLREIRRRLEGLSRNELAALAAGPAEPPSSPTARPSQPFGIAPTLPSAPTPPPGSPRRTPSFVASLLPPRRGLAEPQLGAAYVLGEEPPVEPPNSASRALEAEVEASVWNRVTLAPGVELSYQLTGDRLRDSAILRLVRIARQILA
jgi:DNA-binding transcriptional MerR regulator